MLGHPIQFLHMYQALQKLHKSKFNRMGCLFKLLKNETIIGA